MQLIERYVTAVGRRLPRKRRAEIQDELRATLLDALEQGGDRAASEDDVVAAIRRLGPPQRVAASYYPAGQYLIGPELYPIFRRVTALLLSLLPLGMALAFAVSLWVDPPAYLGARFADWVGMTLEAVLVSLGVLVVAFALVQRLEVRPQPEGGDWDPRRLPAVRPADVADRAHAVAAIVCGAVFLVLLNGLAAGLESASAAGVELLAARALTPNLVWVNAALLLGIAVQTVLLVRGYWRSWTRLLHVAGDLLAVYAAYRIARGVAGAAADLAAAGWPERLTDYLALNAYVVAGIIAVIVLADAALTLRRHLAGGSGESAHGLVGESSG